SNKKDKKMSQKRDIVKTIAERLELSQVVTKQMVQEMLDVIIETIVESGRIELRNFGVFEVRHRAPRVAQNPMTGEKVKVPAKTVVGFRPGRAMEQKVAALVKKRKKTAGK
ncbi:MAG: HU family DNA-binding protein, partial [Thermoguttaceae bacterium]